MFGPEAFIMANFTIPEELGTNPQSLLLLLPLVAAIAIVYKATKLPAISARSFIRETMLLSASITVIMIITAIILLAVAWFVTQ
ncbi:MAG: hypothetical protein JW749_07065 [Sedimentisphaerales bacterium]|nr:hypothetical protein [Sedimentisphaerales bacterium]